MSQEVLFTVGMLTALTMWLVMKHAFAMHRARRQREIARRGAACQGTVVAIQRPFMFDSCTRLYFDFSPPGAGRPLRACHVDHRPGNESLASLPAAGTAVAVRYLPERPKHAVICKLVAEFVQPEPSGAHP